jgi:hypothetical protein
MDELSYLKSHLGTPRHREVRGQRLANVDTVKAVQFDERSEVS